MVLYCSVEDIYNRDLVCYHSAKNDHHLPIMFIRILASQNQAYKMGQSKDTRFLHDNLIVEVKCVLDVPPTAKVIWRQGHHLQVASDRRKKLGIKLVTPQLQGELFIHYTTRFDKLI